MAFSFLNYINPDGSVKEDAAVRQTSTEATTIASPETLARNRIVTVDQFQRWNDAQKRNFLENNPGWPQSGDAAPTQENYATIDATYANRNTPQQPSSGGDYAKSNEEYEALLQKYQQGIDVSNPDSVRQLAAKMQADGIPAEVSSDGLLIRVPGYDGGWVDARQDKAYVEGRGGIRGWAFQPYYGKEDFNRLVAEGRNPHTGAQALPGQQFSRDQDAPISGPGAQGGLPPGFSLQGQNGLSSFSAPGLLAPFTEQFKAPTDTSDPGFQFALNKGLEAIERSAAAKGTLLTGGMQKDLLDYGTGMALQGYDKEWNREFDLWGAKNNIWQSNQNNAYNKLAGTAGMGMDAATNYGNTAANVAIGQGNVNAGATVAGTNATNAGLGNATNIGLSVFDQWRKRRQGQNLGTIGAGDTGAG